MYVETSKTELETMRKEALCVQNSRNYIILCIFVLMLVICVIMYIKHKKTVAVIGVIMCLIGVLVFSFGIYRNYRSSIIGVSEYSKYDTIKVKIENTGHSLIINNYTLGRITEIESNMIDKIIYKEHTIVIITKDKKMHMLANCMNLDELLQKE